jgi:hypothetical protein
LDVTPSKGSWFFACFLCATIVFACSDEPADTATSDVGRDLDAQDSDADAPDITDSTDSTDSDAWDADARDADVPDTRDVPEDTPPRPCPEPPAGPAPAGGRWALSMFHFNVQYVAGGLEGFAEIALNAPAAAPQTDLTEAEVEDAIITESFAPLIDILDRNPELALTLELQGYMVDLIRERHPALLTRMRRLANNGQLELASIHWSDQFFLAWGRQDMNESWARTQASFAAADLPLGRAVFTQEGQFGEGFAQWLHLKRPDSVMVMARNLQGFYQNGLPDQPLWSVGEQEVVLPRGFTDERIEKTFVFFDDGELLATGDLNPYVGRSFVRMEGFVRNFERKLQCLHQNGYRVGRVSDYVDAAKAQGVEAQPMPPFLDGTWQPRSTTGPLRWLGGAGDAWPHHERDNLVLTTCATARHQVLALDTAVEFLGDAATPADRAALDTAWKELLWGQVSDARGVNPWWGEVLYGLEHCGNGGQAAADALESLRVRRQAGALIIDTDQRTVADAQTAPDPAPWFAAQAPLALTIVHDGGRQVDVDWQSQDAESTPDSVYRARVTWNAVVGSQAEFDACLTDDDTDGPWDCDLRRIEPVVLQFPRAPGAVIYRPALGDAVVEYNESQFDLEPAALEEGIWSVAADGLVGVEGGYVVKRTTTVHLGVGWRPGQPVVEFRDETLQPRFADTWEFFFTQDRETALALARENIAPTVIVAPR